jgi:hypothetical protein
MLAAHLRHACLLGRETVRPNAIMIAMDSPITFRTRIAPVSLELSSLATNIQDSMVAAHVVQVYEPVSVVMGMQPALGVRAKDP